MKKYLIIFLILVAGIQFSCNEDLDPKVYSSLTSENAFQSKSDAVSAVNAVYAKLKGPWVGGNSTYWATRHFALTDVPTDLGHTRAGGDPRQLAIGLWDAANGLISQDYLYPYKLIANANSAINSIEGMTAITDTEKAQFLAEIKFLRAVSYMDLTDSFGPVVLLTEDDFTDADYNNPKEPSSVEEIDALLISDLTAAAEVLPLNYVDNAIYGSNDVGRASKGSALTLLMKLHLRSLDWQKVVDLSEEIMELNQYELYPTYAGLFKEANQWCEENIFSVMGDSQTNGMELLNHFGPMNHPVIKNRWHYYGVAWDFYDTFGDEDERKQSFYPEYVGIDGLLYTQPPSFGAVPPEGEFYMQNVPTSKYADPESQSYYDSHSVSILRYADVLLSRAEAINELSGPTTEAINLINEVKGRSKANLLSLSGLTKETLRDAILQERGWEFFYEGKRRADLIRMNKYEVLVNAHLNKIGQPSNISMPKNKYFPYPQSQVDLNPNLSNADR